MGYTDANVQIENRTQRRSDYEAFTRLSKGQKERAQGFARFMYRNRRRAGNALGIPVSIAGNLIQYGFIEPYKWTSRKINDAAAAVLDMIPEGAITALPRAALALGRGVIIAASAVAKTLTHGERQGRVMKTLQGAYDALFHARDHVVEWGKRFKKNVRANLRIFKRRSSDAFEYYGAIGLYSATKKILAMRWNGKPIFGNETVNKAAGLAIAGAGFALLTAGLLAAGAMAKVWHAHLLLSAATDTAPWMIVAAKQAILHPLITIGVTAAKGIALPMIAATRQALKTFDFTQGVAYAYNTMLRQGRMHDREAQKTQALQAAVQPQAQPRSTVPSLVKHVALKTLFNEKATKKFGSLMHYFIEKASPAHYEGRMKTFGKRSRYKTSLAKTL